MATSTIAAPTQLQQSTSSVFDIIRARVLRHEILPNTKINIDQLARELQVSPTPIREALKQLQGDNLVVQEPGRGYRTTPILKLEELRELFEFRMLIEPWAAKIAAGDRLSNPGRTLAAQIDELSALMAQHQDVRYELMDHDIVFHDTILASTSNEVLRGAFAQTHCHLHAFRLHPSDQTGAFTLREHTAINDAIRNRDPEAAEAAMREHLARAYIRFEEGHAAAGELHSLQNILLPGLHPERPTINTTLAL